MQDEIAKTTTVYFGRRLDHHENIYRLNRHDDIHTDSDDPRSARDRWHELVSSAPSGVALDLLKAVDWDSTSVGPVDSWSVHLYFALNMILHSPTPMYVMWGQDRTLFFNNAFAPNLGPRLSRSMAKPFREVWGEEVWSRRGKELDLVFSGLSMLTIDQPILLHRGGHESQTFWTFSFSPLYDLRGDVIAVLAVVDEQTARIDRERRQRSLTASLREEIVRRLADLNTVEDQLRHSQKVEAIGQLTGGVAHDFNNLLTVISGSIELLRQSDLCPRRKERYLDAVAEAAERAARLTGQLLAFARRQALKSEAFDVGASLSDGRTILTTLLGAGVCLDVFDPPQPLFVLADRGQFDTAVVNMAVNARDAMKGTGRLAVTIEAVGEIPATSVQVAVPGEFVVVSVRDTGPGIELAHLERLCEPFYTTKALGAGTGLGLSQVFGFAKQSGGDLRIRSALGEGATFDLYLPRAQASTPHAAPVGKVHDQREGEGLCVLLVEDDSAVGQFAESALASRGYECVLTTGGEEALAALEALGDKINVIVSDVVMPKMSGLELASIVKKTHPELPLVLASGYNRAFLQGDCDDYDFLQKPYTVEMISSAVSKVLP